MEGGGARPKKAFSKGGVGGEGLLKKSKRSKQVAGVTYFGRVFF